MVDLSLSEEQQLLQKTARDFAENEIKPVAEEIESMDRTKFTPWDKCEDLVRKGTKLGFTTILIPEEYGGGGMGCMENVIIQEELGAADVGIASAYFNCTATAPMLIINGGTEAQKRKFLSEICSSDVHVLASAGSEPGQSGSDSLCPYPDPSLGMRTTARRDGDDYIINGAKSGFITNAGVAKSYYVIARNDLKKPPLESTSIYYVSADLPGINIGKREELIGWKTAHNAEVYFEDVRVSKDSLLGDEGESLPIFIIGGLPYIGTGFAAVYTGLARASYEYAVDYARKRVSWLQPIIKHQAVAAMIADMAVDYQAARLMVWDSAYAADSNAGMEAGLKALSAKTFATEVAIKNAQSCVKVLGSYGIATAYKAGKYLCDAWIGYSCDGTNTVLRLQLASFIEC
jgi:alkylation response protein AidB-like acyl-CoA dehydrogenase